MTRILDSSRSAIVASRSVRRPDICRRHPRPPRSQRPPHRSRRRKPPAQTLQIDRKGLTTSPQLWHKSTGRASGADRPVVQRSARPSPRGTNCRGGAGLPSNSRDRSRSRPKLLSTRANRGRWVPTADIDRFGRVREPQLLEKNKSSASPVRREPRLMMWRCAWSKAFASS